MVTCQDEFIGNPLVNNWSANNNVTQIMDTTAVEQHWDLILRGGITLAGWTTPPSAFADAPETLVYSVRVNANAAVPGGVNETFKSVDMAYLRFVTNLYEQQDVYRVAPATTNASQGFETSPRLYFGDPVAIDSTTGKSAEARYWLDGRLLSASGLTLSIGWRDSSGLFYGGVGGTYSGLQATIVVKSRHYFGIPNQTAQGTTIARQYIREAQQQFPVLSSGVDQQFYNLRVGAILHRLVIKGLVAPTGTTVSFGDPSYIPLGGNNTRAEGARVKLKVNNNALVPLDAGFTAICRAYPKLFNLANANSGSATFSSHVVYEPSSSHSIQSMLNLRAAINMTLWADTTVAATPTSLLLSYVERVRPQ
jgi:hypothetical protein